MSSIVKTVSLIYLKHAVKLINITHLRNWDSRQNAIWKMWDAKWTAQQLACESSAFINYNWRVVKVYNIILLLGCKIQNKHRTQQRSTICIAWINHPSLKILPKYVRRYCSPAKNQSAIVESIVLISNHNFYSALIIMHWHQSMVA